MNIWNKVLLGLIAVVLIPFFYFSVLALKTHQYWRSTAKALEAQVKTLEKGIVELQYGDPAQPDKPCLQSIRIDLYKYYVDRGRIWRNCAFQAAKGNEVSLVIDQPDPHEIAPNVILYAFDQAAVKDGGCFLGEFKVTAVDKKPVVMTPMTPRLTPKAMQRIKGGKGTWMLCEVMPCDMREAFAGVDEKQMREMFPAQVVEEYLTDGKDGKQRTLRDYQVLFKELDRQQAVLAEDCVAASRLVADMKVASTEAREQLLLRQAEKASLIADLDKLKIERDAAVSHEKSLEEELALLNTGIRQLIEDNKVIAKEIGKIQFELVRQVDRRTTVAAH